MPFSDIYIATFKNDIEYNQLLLQTATALQTNKFIQVGVLGGKAFVPPVYLNNCSLCNCLCPFVSLFKLERMNWTS